MSVLTVLFWYLAIGAIVAVRAFYRFKPILNKLYKLFEKEVPEWSFSVESGVHLAILIVPMIAWPVLLTRGWKMIFTNKPPKDDHL